MVFNFSKLFESMGYCREKARVTISAHSNRFPIKIEDSWLYGGRTMRYYSPSNTSDEIIQAQNEEANSIFIDCIKNFVGKNQETPEIKSLIGRFQKRAAKKAPLTAGKIRSAYKTCIANFLEGYRKIAVLGKDTDRLVLESDENGCTQFRVHNVGLSWFNAAVTEQNRKAVAALKDSLINDWGEIRVTRAQKRHQIDLDAMFAKGETLRVEHINTLMIGLADYFLEDLHEGWDSLKSIVSDEKQLSQLPRLSLKRLADALDLDVSDEEGILRELKENYGNDLLSPFKALKPHVLSLIQRMSLLDARELELAFQGRHLEGIVDGLQKSFSSFFVFYPQVEDLERLHMYQMILNAKDRIDESQLETFYDEILTKGIVKKQMVAEMLIPSPWKDVQNNFESPHFYAIKIGLKTGYAKLGYYLTPVGNSQKKDILVFRSTSSAPSSEDGFSTVLTGFYPFEPVGYLWRHMGVDKEKFILDDSKRTLRVMGHSLGGCHSMLFLLNHIKRRDNDEFEDDLPLRDYEIVTFDSPKIKLQCAQGFNKWLESPASEKLHNKISITHYISTGDPVPLLGESFLGDGADSSKLKSVKVIQLTPQNNDHPLLSYHPHACHYFRTVKNKNFKEEEIPINDTRTEKWHLVEVIRRIVGFILMPLLWISYAIKALIFGLRRHLDDQMSKVWEKIYPEESLA